MSIQVIKEGNLLKVIESSAPIPEGVKLTLYTAAELNDLGKQPPAWEATQLESAFHDDEVQQATARTAWLRLPEESKEDIMHQTQSKSYQEWMKDTSWDEAMMREDPACWLPIEKFQP